jgi:hypothetical protein
MYIFYHYLEGRLNRRFDLIGFELIFIFPLIFFSFTLNVVYAIIAIVNLLRRRKTTIIHISSVLFTILFFHFIYMPSNSFLYGFKHYITARVSVKDLNDISINSKLIVGSGKFLVGPCMRYLWKDQKHEQENGIKWDSLTKATQISKLGNIMSITVQPEYVALMWGKRSTGWWSITIYDSPLSTDRSKIHISDNIQIEYGGS